HPRDRRVIVSNIAQNLAGLLRVKFVEPLSPLKIPNASGREAGSGNLPAANVLRSCCEPQWLGRIGREAIQPVGHSLRVRQRIALRVALVRFIKPRDRYVETITLLHEYSPPLAA